MNKTHEQSVEEAFERMLADDDYKNYKREDFEDFFLEHYIENCVPVIVHCYAPKGAIPKGQTIELFSERQISNVLIDRARLMSLVQLVADGKVPSVEEANEVLKALTNEPLF